MLENTFSSVDSHKEYRAYRYLYYFVIPQLARHLWFGPDRERLEAVEIYFYNQLLSYRFKKSNHREPSRVPLWSSRCLGTYEVGPSPAKL